MSLPVTHLQHLLINDSIATRLRQRERWGDVTCEAQSEESIGGEGAFGAVSSIGRAKHQGKKQRGQSLEHQPILVGALKSVHVPMGPEPENPNFLLHWSAPGPKRTLVAALGQCMLC